MASIQQQPGLWNLAYVPNVWTVQSGTTDSAAIAVEVNGTTVATIRQNHNQAGVSHFDVSKILQAQLEPKFFETIPQVSDLENLSLQYRVRYGDVNANGTINWTAYSATKYITNGYEDWNILDWNENPYRATITDTTLCEVGSASNVRIDEKSFLTNYPGTQKVTDNDYHTLSFYNWVANQTSEVWADAPWFVEITYTYPDATTSTASYTILEAAGLGPRTATDDLGPYIYEPSEYIGHIGVGPKNLQDAGIWPPEGVADTAVNAWNLTGTTTYDNATGPWNGTSSTQNVDLYSVRIYSLDRCYYETAGAPPANNPVSDYFGDLMYEAEFENIDTCGAFDPVRVSFLNQYGVKDYFTFDKRNTYNVETTRTNYKQSLGSWNSGTFAIDQVGRGLRTFASSLKERMSMETNWLTDAESLWLQELFTSSHINLYYQDKWIPAVITSKVYDEKTVARQKLYRYTLEIEYANQQKRQRG